MCLFSRVSGGQRGCFAGVARRYAAGLPGSGFARRGGRGILSFAAVARCFFHFLQYFAVFAADFGVDAAAVFFDEFDVVVVSGAVAFQFGINDFAAQFAFGPILTE